MMYRDYLMEFFRYDHLSAELQEVSQPFFLLAERIHNELPQNEERHEALRKLLEAKDCAVRATLLK
jgi:hypothetical protein